MLVEQYYFQLIIESDDPSSYEFRDINEQNLVAVVSRKVNENSNDGLNCFCTFFVIGARSFRLWRSDCCSS